MRRKQRLVSQGAERNMRAAGFPRSAAFRSIVIHGNADVDDRVASDVLPTRLLEAVDEEIGAVSGRA
jgi:hypothetical protein